MANSIDELRAAIEEQNEIHKRELVLQHEAITVKQQENQLLSERNQMDLEVAEQQRQLRDAIERMLTLSRELVLLMPMLNCVGDSQSLILALLELLVQPLYRAVLKEELSGDLARRLEGALADLTKMRTQIAVYGQVQSNRDTQIAGESIRSDL
jgi:hypothetical protein